MIVDSSEVASACSLVFANPKSSTFTDPSGRIFTFSRLQIAMDDALLMRGFEEHTQSVWQYPARHSLAPARVRCIRARVVPSINSITR